MGVSSRVRRWWFPSELYYQGERLRLRCLAVWPVGKVHTDDCCGLGLEPCLNCPYPVGLFWVTAALGMEAQLAGAGHSEWAEKVTPSLCFLLGSISWLTAPVSFLLL